MSRFFTASMVLGWALAAHAAEGAQTLDALATTNSGVSILRVGGALALVVGLFLAGVWLFRNWQRVVWRTRGAPKLNVIEVRPLGGRHALYVVGYDQQRLLLAASPTGVQFITHLPDADGSALAVPAEPRFARAFDNALVAASKPDSEITAGKERS